jgi:hypothetical protein
MTNVDNLANLSTRVRPSQDVRFGWQRLSAWLEATLNEKT